jgi:triacylglycerol esterase/lipase EstA (alpha/beta hydrolase family)
MQNRSHKNFINRLFSFALCIAILSGAFSAQAQTRRTSRTVKTSTTKNSPPTKTAANKQTSQNCNGGWSGIVTFTKTRNYMHDTGKTKSTSFGTETHKKYSQNYKYTGRIVVDGSQNPNSLVTNSQVTLTDVRKSWSRFDQRDSCFYDGIDGTVPQWTEKNESDITNAFGEGASQFSMSVNELGGTYSFSFRFPQSNGTNDRTYDKTAGGWCNPEFNKPENSVRKSPEKVDGEGAEISDQKIDQARPDVLSGSKTWETGSMDSTKTTFTVTWSFKRCPAPVEVTGIRFDEHPYPDYRTWKEIETARGTIDGNIVRIRATITNFSGETKFPTVKFNELVENWTLPEGEKNIRLEPGESRELELEWDTSGYAWKGKGWDAESYRKIKVEAVDEGRTSELTKLVVVKPRPVILAHGLWSNAAAWKGYDKFFAEGHSADWKSYAVGADPSVAKMNTGETFGNSTQTNTVKQNAVELGNQIEFVRKDLNAWHVDVVAHSMGGLITRRYIHSFMPNNPLSRKPVITKLIMLGTPNQGSPCANLMYAAFAAKGDKIWALWELSTRQVEKFNQLYTDRRGVRFSSLVGKAIPSTCHAPLRGDGVVSIGSARWMIKDWKYSNSLTHTDLTSHADFGAFVFPRLSTGPRGNHDPEIMSAGNYSPQTDDFADASSAQADRYGFNSYFQKTSYKREARTDDDEQMSEAQIEGLTLSEHIKLSANQTTEISVPITDGSRASVIFAAAPNISATLIDAEGNVVGKNLADTPESKQMFRSITVEKAVTKGNWKLKLENHSAKEETVFAAAFSDQNPLAFSVSAGKPTAAKQIPLQAKLSNNGSPIKDAKITARINNAQEIAFYDDGKNGDGAAGDGIYGAAVENLADGDYLVEARAETNDKAVSAETSFTVGAAETKQAKAKLPK